MKLWLFNQAGCRVAYATWRDLYLPDDRLVATMRAETVYALGGKPIGAFYGDWLCDENQHLLAVADLRVLAPGVHMPLSWSAHDPAQWLQQAYAQQQALRAAV